jgi:hypothetical protein
MKKILFMSSLFILPVGSLFFFFKDQISKKIIKRKVEDSTRYGTNYYGLNWGARTDEIVNIF